MLLAHDASAPDQAVGHLHTHNARSENSSLGMVRQQREGCLPDGPAARAPAGDTSPTMTERSLVANTGLRLRGDIPDWSDGLHACRRSHDPCKSLHTHGQGAILLWAKVDRFQKFEFMVPGDPEPMLIRFAGLHACRKNAFADDRERTRSAHRRIRIPMLRARLPTGCSAHASRIARDDASDQIRSSIWTRFGLHFWAR